MQNFEKLAALGAQAVAGGALAAWAGFVFITRPGPGGGIDARAHIAVAAASFALVLWLAAAHWWMGAQLKGGPDSIRG